MTIILGPCPCQGCGRLVWYRRSWNSGKPRWHDANARAHRCKATA